MCDLITLILCRICYRQVLVTQRIIMSQFLFPWKYSAFQLSWKLITSLSNMAHVAIFFLSFLSDSEHFLEKHNETVLLSQEHHTALHTRMTTLTTKLINSQVEELISRRAKLSCLILPEQTICLGAMCHPYSACILPLPWFIKVVSFIHSFFF